MKSPKRKTSFNSFKAIDRQEEKVILVNEKDRAIGVAEKIKAHREGRLHRAFSIFIFNAEGKLLIQRRTTTKYHSGNLWTNTCCGHPRPGEPLLKAAHRRLKEEMGFTCELKEVFSFIYEATLDNHLYEKEFDHVMIGRFDGDPGPDPAEASDWQWIDLKRLRKKIQKNPDDYTPWLKIAIDKMIIFLQL